MLTYYVQHEFIIFTTLYVWLSKWFNTDFVKFEPVCFQNLVWFQYGPKTESLTLLERGNIKYLTCFEVFGHRWILSCSPSSLFCFCLPLGIQMLSVQPDTKPKGCAGCNRKIKDRYLLKALDKYWHEDCLKCACCDCRLGEVGSTLYTKANLILCRRDYLR